CFACACAAAACFTSACFAATCLISMCLTAAVLACLAVGCFASALFMAGFFTAATGSISFACTGTGMFGFAAATGAVVPRRLAGGVTLESAAADALAAMTAAVMRRKECAAQRM